VGLVPHQIERIPDTRQDWRAEEVSELAVVGDGRAAVRRARTPFYPHSRLNERFAGAFEQASRLLVTVERGEEVSVLRVGGQIDLTNVASWRVLLAAVSAATAADEALVVDLGATGFLGLCAFAALVETAEQCRDRGIDVRLVGTQPLLARFIGICRPRPLVGARMVGRRTRRRAALLNTGCTR